MRPLLSLSFSEGTSGGVSCNVSQHDVPDRSRFLSSTVLIRLGWFLTMMEMTIMKMIITTQSNGQMWPFSNIDGVLSSGDRPYEIHTIFVGIRKRTLGLIL